MKTVLWKSKSSRTVQNTLRGLKVSLWSTNLCLFSNRIENILLAAIDLIRRDSGLDQAVFTEG